MKTMKNIAFIILVLCSQMICSMDEQGDTYDGSNVYEIGAIDELKYTQRETAQGALLSFMTPQQRAQLQKPLAYIPSQQGTLRTHALTVNVATLSILNEVKTLILKATNVIIGSTNNSINQIADKYFYYYTTQQEIISDINSKYTNPATHLPEDLHKKRPAFADIKTLNRDQIDAKNKEIVAFNNAYILPYNNSHPKNPVQLLKLLNPGHQPHNILSFFPQNPNNIHITLLTIGDLYDGDPLYNEIIKTTSQEITNAIAEWSGAEKRKAIYCTTGRIKWPPYGGLQKVWMPLSVAPKAPQDSESLISLLNTIKDHLQKVQTQYGNCFMYAEKLPRKFTHYSKRATDDITTGNTLHISLGNFIPPYEKWQMVPIDQTPKQPNARKVRTMIGHEIWVDQQGSPIQELAQEFNFMDRLDQEQKVAVLKRLGVSELGPYMFGADFTLSKPNFTITSIEFTSKSSKDAKDIQRHATFNIP